MRVRAILFDIYGTLFRVGLPPADADQQWVQLFREELHMDPPMNRLAFAAACSRVVALRHQWARARGIRYPEVNWPTVVTEVLPAVARLPVPARDRFIHRQMQLGRRIEPYTGAIETLRGLRADRRLLGLVSNAQAYTREELRHWLEAAGMGLDTFHPSLCFYSFEHGYAKPDPHVFQWVTVRLEALGVRPEETLMVGDRLDNDIEPARAFGWQSWHFTSHPGDGLCSGNWDQLRHHLLVRNVE